jgi:hypothetical protein
MKGRVFSKPDGYVVLWGERGISPEFRKLERAKIFAKQKAMKLWKPVVIDELEGSGQVWHSIITPTGRTMSGKEAGKYLEEEFKKYVEKRKFMAKNQKRKLRRVI